jgi:DNA-3-methyladenine glycosylase II
MQEHCAVVTRTDRAFTRVIRDAELCPIGRRRPTSSHFESLVRAVTAQQISTSAARSIYARLTNTVGGTISPEAVATTPLDELRSAGLSAAKTRTITELADAATSGAVNFQNLARQSDEAIISELTVIHGIGRWTVEMFLMSQLGRLDVWPVGDLGVRRGWDNLHPGSASVTPARLFELGEPFAGRRSVVAWYCWRAA